MEGGITHWSHIEGHYFGVFHIEVVLSLLCSCICTYIMAIFDFAVGERGFSEGSEGLYGFA